MPILPNSGMSLEELQRYIDENPGPVADVGFNPNNPGPQDIRGQGPSIFDRTSDQLQLQQAAGNIAEEEVPPTIPDSIKSLLAQPPVPVQQTLDSASKITAPYKPVSQINDGYGAGADDAALSAALENQKQMAVMAMLGRAGATIGAGIAGMGGQTPIKAATEGYESLEKIGSQGVEAVKTKRAAKDEETKRRSALFDQHDKEMMQDPNSPTSQFYRSMVRQSNPNLTIPENLPASKLKDLGLKLPLNDRKKYNFITVEDENGRPTVAIADPDTGQIVQTGFARGYAPKIDPRTGEFRDSSGLTSPMAPAPNTTVIGTAGAAQATEAGTQQNKPSPEPQFNVRQEKEILNRQTKLYSSPGFKDAQQFIQEAQTAKALAKDAQTNPMAYNMLGTVVARAFQGGRLTDKDVVMYTGRRDWVGRAEQAAKEAMSGTFKKENADLLTSAIDAIVNKEQHVVDSIYKQEAEKISKVFNLPTDAVLRRLAPDTRIGGRDPKIEEWAKKYHYDYDAADRLLRSRGYGK